ncbi:MAG: glycogen synthase GlgA [Planctomycetota bacterium]
MNVILVSSEVVPFAKTGGLADVTGALPGELRKAGHEVSVFMPGYAGCLNANADIEATDIKFSIPLGKRLVEGSLHKSRIPGTDVTIYFVCNEQLFNRPGIYGENGEDYSDNSTRFIFFCRAVVEAVRMLELSPDIVHCNDWQTGLIPAIIKLECASVPAFENAATLMTIHNLAYQGTFWHWDMLITGIDWKHFNWQEMEFHGNLNLLKTGLVYADGITTVSPTYAREIQTAEQGCGLEGLLQHRRNVLSGILNGIDPGEWNPATDELIPFNFDADNVGTGKPECKRVLQEESGLEINPDVPLIGIVGRLASQKGWSLILPVMRQWLESHDAQWVVLGTGDQNYHAVLTSLHRTFPKKLGLTLDFSNRLAHRIEAGSDLFVMPSQYEPCGLNQMYSMAYGTVPVVRATGGLADTVINASPENLAAGRANGFSFEPFTAEALDSTLARACAMYIENKEAWRSLIQNGMNRDWSWSASANRYVEIYQDVINRHRQTRATQSTG